VDVPRKQAAFRVGEDTASRNHQSALDLGMGASLPNVPPHLRQFVVEQDYARYTAIDQAVWRFVLLQTRARLVETAHPAYRNGLDATGISVERIPNITEMNERLGRFGWGAVCVDGFIPPRAFQEFQARGILPIAADIRTLAHLAYTPAPDIIHEAAGHAPILTDSAYASYLRRIGEIGKRAFTLPEEQRVFDAIHLLSEVKEDTSRSTESVRRVEAELALALEAAKESSEASELSRLYWWTAEYGLVGTPANYRLYGAGLLSSLGESHSCHSPTVEKLPLDESVIRVSYDITKPQPQLFVTPSFEALHDVLERVSRTLAFERGGALAITRAIASRELASARFSSGAWVIGVLSEAGPRGNAPTWLRFTGPVAFAWDGVIDETQRDLRPGEQLILTGPLRSGARLERIGDAELARGRDEHSGRHVFEYASGARVEGRLVRHARRHDGRLLHLLLADVRVEAEGRAPQSFAEFVLIPAGDFVTAQAGAVDPSYFPVTDFPGTRVPKPRVLPERDLELLELYQAALVAHQEGPDAMKEAFPLIHTRLGRDFPREWLLRWNLLESLQKRDLDSPRAASLKAELQALEIALNYEQPIATGLRYLASVEKRDTLRVPSSRENR
jgi:phenylalanine-4-hydroxylase